MKKIEIKKIICNLKFKNIINIIGLLSILFISTAIFFKYKLIIFPDSETYYKLSQIIMGNLHISNWRVVRGFGFPLIITIWIKLFGDTSTGLLIGTYLFYLILIVGIGYLLQKMLKYNNIENTIPFCILYVLTIVLNPLILGYSHTLLTESIMPGIYVIEVFLCIKWLGISFKNNKNKFIIYTLIFSLFGVLVWFIKQPYAPAYYGAMVFVAFASWIYSKKIYYFLEKIISLIFCLIILILSLLLWNSYLMENANLSSNESTSGYMTNGFLGGLTIYYSEIGADKYCDRNYINNLDLSKSEKKLINKKIDNSRNWCDQIRVYEIKNADGTHVSNEILISKKGNITTFDSIKFLLKNYIEHPSYILRVYFHNYLRISDIEDEHLFIDTNGENGISPYIFGENISNGMWTFQDKMPSVFSFVYNENYENFRNYNTITMNYKDNITQLIWINKDLCFYMFKILIFLSIPMFFYSFIKMMITKSYNYFIVSLLSSIAVFDIGFNIFMDAIIDRYVYAVYPLLILSLYILFMEKNTVKKSKD